MLLSLIDKLPQVLAQEDLAFPYTERLKEEENLKVEALATFDALVAIKDIAGAKTAQILDVLEERSEEFRTIIAQGDYAKLTEWTAGLSARGKGKEEITSFKAAISELSNFTIDLAAVPVISAWDKVLRKLSLHLAKAVDTQEYYSFDDIALKAVELLENYPHILQKARAKYKYIMGDYLDMRYAKAFRAITSTMMAVGTLALFSGQLIGIAWILDVVAGIDKLYGIIIGSVVVTIYFSAGGLRSAAIVNILELVVILLGFIVATPFALNYVGGFNGLQSAITQNIGNATQTASYFAWDGIGYTAIIGYFLMLTPAFCISPGLIGKVYSAENTRAVKIGTLLNGIVQLLFAFCPLLIGMCAYAAFPELKNQELALPTAMVLIFWQFRPF